MKTKLVFLIWTCLFYGGLSLWANQNPILQHGIHQAVTLPADPTFEYLTPVDGLSSSTVNYILQDQQGYVWIATNDGLNRYDGRQFLIFRKKEGLSSSITNELAEDSLGNIWVATSKGVDIVVPNHFIIHPLQFSDGKSLLSLTQKINKLCFTAATNTLFVGTEKGLFELHYDENYTITSFHHLYQQPVYDLDFTDSTGLLVATKEGVWQYQSFQYPILKQVPCLSQPTCSVLGQGDHTIYTATFEGEIIQHQTDSQQTKIFTNKKQDWQKDLITELLVDAQHRLWALSYGDGVHVLDMQQAKLLYSYQHQIGHTDGLFTNVLECMMLSQSGLLWLGTANGGANLLNPHSHNQAFQLIRNDLKNNLNLMANGIHGIYVQADGTIVLGMDGGGLHILAPNKKKAHGYMIKERFHSSNTFDLPSDHFYKVYQEAEKGYWLGNWEGLVFYDSQKDAFKNFSKKNVAMGQAAVMTMAKDSSGMYWIGTRYNGVASFNNTSYPAIEFNWYDTTDPKGIQHNRVEALHIDAQNKVWIGTMGGGISVLSRNRKQFTHFRHQPNRTNSLSSDLILCFYQQNDSLLWIGTHGGGLNKMNIWTQQFTTYTTEDGLANNVVYAILPDEQGNLWMSTNFGLSKFNPTTTTFQNFDVRDGLQDNEFNRHAAFRGEDGTLYFGGINGLTYFNPVDIKLNEFIPPLAITEIKVNQQAVPITNQLELAHDQNLLSFEFAALNYQQSAKNQYRYQLVGVDEDWIEGGTRNAITYSHLPSGKYTLKIKGANNDGVWNEAGIALPITIAYPWWATSWAYLFYFIVGGTIVYLTSRFLFNKKLAEAEANRLKELDMAKTTLYTNITHEFRTPLTVIQGMATELEKCLKKDPFQKLGLIKKNSQELLNLVNQLLDLSKLQLEKTTLSYQQGDLIAFLKYATEAHESYAKIQQLDLQFYTEEERLMMDFDAQKIEQILSNLISNAIKFTPAYGKILVVVKKTKIATIPRLTIKVIDNGIGITADQLPHIFNRFHRVDDTHTSLGTGLGLAIVKELVQLMEGTIEVKSKEKEGTTFLLTFPIKQQAPIEKTMVSTYTKPVVLPSPMIKEQPPYESALPLVLIIEDNIDVTYYLTSFLAGIYQILTASNGEEGVNLALEKIPDLIISDVMMPKRNGFEVCHQLKTDERTNHIPIILLTAKATTKDKLEGLQKGADAYLLKPFEQEELLIRLQKLLEIRRLLQLKYSQNLLQPPSPKKQTAPPTSTNEFLQKAETSILAHLEITTFGGEELAKSLLLSRSQLYRKIKALTGMSTGIYIRRVRLQQARLLLQEGDLPISEVAYRVGFKSPVYFSQVFKETYGERPTAVKGKNLPL